MNESNCDIVPHSAGWIYILDGVQSPAYPSYAMAVSAARTAATTRQRRITRDKIVLRLQTLRGEMRTLNVIDVPRREMARDTGLRLNG